MSVGKTRPTRIYLIGGARFEEGVADADIYPGMLIKVKDNARLAPHADAGGPAERNFALEDALQGRTIDDKYVQDELTSYCNARPGDVVLAWLADGESVDDGDLLASNGDGRLAKVTASDVPIGVALEALDLSESSNATAGRIRVRVM